MMLTPRIIAALAGIAVIYFGVYATLEHAHKRGYDEAVAKYTTQALLAEVDARTKESQLNKQLVEAQNAAVIRGQENKKLSDNLAASTVQLRNYTTDIRNRLPTNSCETNRATADAALTVFADCTRKYTEMAENATGHASDVKTLEDRWPEIAISE